MSDTPATMAALRALLVAGDGVVPVAAAGELRRQAAELGGDVSTLAALAADASLPPWPRVIALLAVALALAEAHDAAAPDGALDAVEDPEVVDAAIAAGLAGALTGVLRAAPLDGSLRATRRLIGRRCLAAGENGPHVARLLLDAGDPDGAGRAAGGYLAGRLPERGPPAPETRALLLLLPGWMTDPAFAAALGQALAEADPQAPERLASALRNHRNG